MAGVNNFFRPKVLIIAGQTNLVLYAWNTSQYVERIAAVVEAESSIDGCRGL